MTGRAAYLYSSTMIGDLSTLEKKLEHFLTVHDGLRSENQELRTRVATLEAEKRKLDERLAQACSRLEAILDKLPE